MRRRYVLSNAAERDLRRLDPEARRRIFEALDRLIGDPPQGDVRKLAGREDEWRLRVGNWRVRFRYDAQPKDVGHGLQATTIVVLRVLDRREAYRD